jgi:hypothetical protein
MTRESGVVRVDRQIGVDRELSQCAMPSRKRHHVALLDAAAGLTRTVISGGEVATQRRTQIGMAYSLRSAPEDARRHPRRNAVTGSTLAAARAGR